MVFAPVFSNSPHINARSASRRPGPLAWPLRDEGHGLRGRPGRASFCGISAPHARNRYVSEVPPELMPVGVPCPRWRVGGA